MLKYVFSILIVLATMLSAKSDKDIVKQINLAKWDKGLANSIIVESYDSTNFTPDGNFISYYHQLIKPITMSGVKDIGTMTFPYDTLWLLLEIKSARIIKPDGKIIKIGNENIKDEISESFAGLIYYGNLREKRISFSGLEVDCGIEVEIVYTTKSPRFEGLFEGRDGFQSEEPILYSRKVLTSNKDAQLNTAVLNDKDKIVTETIEQKGKLKKWIWETRNVPPLISENGMASPMEIIPIVLYSNSNWFELSKKSYALVEPMMTPDSAIKAKVDELIKDAKTEEEKLRRIYYFVATDVRYLGVPMGEKEGIQPHPVTVTFGRREGVCKDKATLLAEMLKLAGIDAWVALSNPIGKVYKEAAVMQFMHMITGARLKDGKIYYMDSTDEYCMDMLPAYSYNKEYLPCIPDGSDLLTFPIQNPEENSEIVNIKSEINFDGTLSATIDYEPKGIYDEVWRQIFRMMEGDKRKQFFMNIVKEIHPEAKIDYYTVQPENLGDLFTPVKISYKITASNYAIPAGKYLLLKPVGYAQDLNILSRFLDSYTKLEKRAFPIQLQFTFSHTITEEIKSPVGFGVELMPDDRALSNDVGEFNMNFISGKEIKFERKFKLKKSYVYPDEYQKLKEIDTGMKGSEKGFIFAVKEEK